MLAVFIMCSLFIFPPLWVEGGKTWNLGIPLFEWFHGPRYQLSSIFFVRDDLKWTALKMNTSSFILWARNRKTIHFSINGLAFSCRLISVLCIFVFDNDFLPLDLRPYHEGIHQALNVLLYQVLAVREERLAHLTFLHLHSLTFLAARCWNHLPVAVP